MKKSTIIILLISIIAIFLGSTIFSYSYEPLDKVAEELNLTSKSIIQSPFPEYTVPGISEWIGGIISGIVGMAMIFLILMVLLKLGK
ncbi:PDGLE domain-containing protein [Fervidicoccus fontis]|uniref:PDGLE domain-containing protein n=1 Tax=Fervidicoccus fontis (strain DSM 19380 / JCM 18336 / VKM B-2539 / Kam940) TaxID=1163730 RepID=I0A254_FERFK|nr:PDGLE domain-containing protein [Fervidicoccus fontis]AFH43061.1 hypothetical protein FFONT_1073 [Fervidicoccus fontis Kam940]